MGCPEVKPMQDWIKNDGKQCKPCMLGPVVAWYKEELESKGKTELVKHLEESANNSDPLEFCKTLDHIKDQVEEKLRERLLDFDCAVQLEEP